MSLETWLEVDRQSLSESLGFTSPHDLPKAVRRHLDGDTLVIEFQYLDDERPYKTVRRDENFSVRVGKHSRRLLGLEIDNGHLAEVAGDRALEEIDKALALESDSRLQNNYSAVKLAVHQLHPRLLPQRSANP